VVLEVLPGDVPGEVSDVHAATLLVGALLGEGPGGTAAHLLLVAKLLLLLVVAELLLLLVVAELRGTAAGVVRGLLGVVGGLLSLLGAGLLPGSVGGASGGK
jgi:hypothetical protein